MSSLHLLSKIKFLELRLTQNLEINVEVSLRDMGFTTCLCVLGFI